MRKIKKKKKKMILKIAVVVFCIALKLMELIEEKAKSIGYIRMILQTREIMESAVKLYEVLGYERIEKYPPYDTLQGAICMAKYI